MKELLEELARFFGLEEISFDAEGFCALRLQEQYLLTRGEIEQDGQLAARWQFQRFCNGVWGRQKKPLFHGFFLILQKRKHMHAAIACQFRFGHLQDDIIAVFFNI